MQTQNPVRIMRKNEQWRRFFSCLQQDKSEKKILKKKTNRKMHLFRMVGLDKTFMQVDITFTISTDYKQPHTHEVEHTKHTTELPPPSPPQKKTKTKQKRNFCNLTCISVRSAALSSATSLEQLLSPWLWLIHDGSAGTPLHAGPSRGSNPLLSGLHSL